jgi:fumarate reductase flavoprotein subunit
MNTRPRVTVAERLDADTQVDALVIGAGACGLVAGLRLQASGVDALIVERDKQALGSTSLSSGFIPAAGTRAQQALGITDSPAQMLQDIQAKAHGRACADLAQAYSQAIGAALDWLANVHGFEWEVLQDFLYPGHSTYRMHTLAQRQGIALVQALEGAFSRVGGTVLTQALVEELVVDAQQRVLGVRMLRPDGQRETIGCRVLLLACNGYGGSPALVQRFIPEMAGAVFAGHVGNDGSAVTWGEALHAGLADMGAYQGHGSWAMPHGSLVTWALMVQGGVQVNMQGQRFHNESLGYSEAAVHVVAQPEQTAWCVFDAPIHSLGLSFPDYLQAFDAGAVKVCASALELASLIGCDAQTLAHTLQAVQPGAADAFGRQFARSLQAPFYAVRVTGALFHTQGGLQVDANCRVLRAAGQTFANLWAGGGAARGVSGPEVSGYLSGNGLLSAVAGGWLAADSMAAFLHNEETP